MKLLIVLLTMLLLAGCRVEKPEETTLQTTQTAPVEATQTPHGVDTTEPTEPGLYISGSYLETDTDGVIRAYDLGGMSVMELRFVGEDVLLVGDTSMDTQMLLLSGERCVVRSHMNAGVYLRPMGDALRATSEEIVYFDSNDNSVVFLTAALKETARLPMPEELRGEPVISSDLTTAYYATDAGLRALDLKTGISRMLRQQEGAAMTPEALLFSDTLLKVSVTEADGWWTTFFLSTDTGELVGQDKRLWAMDETDSFYVIRRTDGYLDEVLYGQGSEPLRSLSLPAGTLLYPQPGQKGTCAARYEENGCAFEWYDFSSGKRTASVMLPEHLSITYAAADPAGNYVWIAAYDMRSDGEVLLRWDLAASAVTDDTDYTSRRYTLLDPDTETLAQLQAQADNLGQMYGVRVTLGTQVVQPDDYVLTPEHRTDAYVWALQVLEKSLQAYPDGFLQKAASFTDSGVLEIALVRDISSNMEGVQYWKGTNAYLAVKIGDKLEQTIYHEICHLLDSTIIPNSYAYDDWEDLNPAGVFYDYNYLDYYYHDMDDCFVDDQRVFVDPYSMTYPKEDRARIMEYAMMPGNEYLFESAIMQRKLYQICTGIRECFNLEKSSKTYLWEQYLKESLAYNK